MVEETFLPGNSVSRVARMHGVAPNQLFGWRRQAASGALTATRAGGEVVPASEYRALENQVRGADIRFVSPSGSALTSAGGLKVVDLEPLPSIVEGVLVVCGGPALESGAGEAMADTLRRTWAGGGIVAGIRGGTIALAAAGLLDDVQHTSNGPDYLASHVPAYRGARHFEETGRAVHCNRIITAPAPAPASFAAEVLLAAGLKAEDAHGILAMLAAEHRA